MSEGVSGIKRWTQIFRAFGNPNRVLIVKMLAKGKRMDVGSIAKKLDISTKATSKHLIILSNLDVLNALGRHNHVFYELNTRPHQDVREAIKLFL
ncbi:MAG: ArsR family transcriptional regulator [Patescibacteria group bacterium]